MKKLLLFWALALSINVYAQSTVKIGNLEVMTEDLGEMKWEEAMEQNVQHKIFSEEEYQDIIGTISEVDFQKGQVNYLRGRVEKQDIVLQKLVNQVSERNFIEAKGKGYDKE